MKPPTDSRQVPLVTKFAFGSGDVGPAVVTSIMSFYLLYFLTDVARIGPFAAGAILAISKIWDSINDPLMGLISDRVRTRWGRRRPWFLFGAAPFGISFFLLFLVPPLDATGKTIYYLMALLLLDTMFTIVNLPYTALTPELTDDYDQRTQLNAFRFSFSIGASIVASVGHKVLVDALSPSLGETGAYSTAALVWAVLIVLPFVFAFWGTYERHSGEPAGEDLSLLDQLRLTFASSPFRFATAIYLASWIVVQAVSQILIYWATYWLRKPGLFVPLVFAVQVVAMLSLFVWSALSERIGKQRVYYAGMSLWVVVSVLLLLVQPDTPEWAVVGLAALAGVGVATAYLIPWAILPDVIEADELETGRRREGAFYGFFVLLQKGGLALASFLIGASLEWAGYGAPPAGTPAGVIVAQPESALTAIRVMIGPLPAIVLILGIVLMSRFPITKEKHQATLAALAARKAQGSHVRLP